MNQPKTIVHQIPASTSNCGPGFDTLGCALTLYNFVRVTQRPDLKITVAGQDADAASQDLAEDAAQLFFNHTGVEHFGFDVEIWGEIPSSRGLGSSATIRAGIVAGLNVLAGAKLSRKELTKLTAALDHAPDNASASIAGGFVIAKTDSKSGQFIETYPFEVEDRVAFVVLSPDSKVSTVAARQVLPPELPFWEAVRSINSTAGIVGAFASKNYENLHRSIYDGIHQPYRKMLNPFVHEAVIAGCDAGAWDGWLSGSGSSIICIGPVEKEQEIGRAMQAIFSENNLSSRVFFLRADNQGITTVSD